MSQMLTKTHSLTQGFSSLSYADLSTSIEIQKANIYHHFASKEDLGLALHALYSERCFYKKLMIIAQSPCAAPRLRLYEKLPKQVLQ
jgi:TetR/AcrR family transcriptional regulator, transcriptional repressor for nem operon